MGLSEILTLLCLILLCAVTALLLLLLRRGKGASAAPADTQELLKGVRSIQQEATQALRAEWQQGAETTAPRSPPRCKTEWSIWDRVSAPPKESPFPLRTSVWRS